MQLQDCEESVFFDNSRLFCLPIENSRLELLAFLERKSLGLTKVNVFQENSQLCFFLVCAHLHLDLGDLTLKEKKSLSDLILSHYFCHYLLCSARSTTRCSPLM